MGLDMTSNARPNKRGATKSRGLKDGRVPPLAKAQSPDLREQELRIIYDSVVDVIYVLAVEGDGKYRFTSVNPAFHTATGLDPEQVVGRRVDEVIPEPALTFVLGKYAEAIREKRFVRWEETSDYPTGRLTGVVSIAPAFDEAGNCTHLVGAVHDITERNRMEEEIRQQNTELEQRVRQRTAELTERSEQLELANQELAKEVTRRRRAEEAALRAADETRFLYSTALVAAYTESFDDALQQCLDLVCGYVGWPVGHLYVPAPDETGDLKPTSVWHLDDARAFGAFRDLTERTTFRRGEGLPGRVLVSGEPAWIVDVQEDDNFPRKPAAKEVGLRSAFGFPIKLGEDTVAVLEFFATEAMPADARILDTMPIVGTQIGRVLERERTRAALVAQAEDLKQSNEELEAFSYSVSHDLRAPLRAMDGFSRILVEDYGPQLPDEAQHYIQVVRDNAKGMGELVDDLLAFSRLGRQPVHKRAIDPRPIVDEVLHELRAEQEGRAVEIEIAELPECQADRALLKQVFANLLANALKYTRKRDPARIEVGSEQRDREVVYFVRDNGAGFDMQYVDKLFGVFQRLHRAEEYEGTGIGLAIVRRIVERHGGRAWATATVDQGATFSFTLEGGGSHG